MILTAEQILALAPDPASAKAGSGQASASKWSGLGGNEQALWGLCQGSGKEPYRAQVELATPAFKCSCPSRKFPCKHGLGLYLLYAQKPAAFGDASVPAWVAEWLQGREQRVEKKAAKQAEADTALTPEDIAAKAQGQHKRQQKREGNVAAGLDLLDTWLADLAREGLAGLKNKPAKDWDAIAARLVDGQAPGLAGRVRRAGMHIYGSSAAGWELAVARELAQLALLSQAYQRLDQLPAPLQNDVRTAVGWVATQEEALAEAGHHDSWLVCGNQTQHEDRISRRACYLRGHHSGRWAMLLQFSAGGQALPAPLLPGTWQHGTLHFYPAAQPLRAVFADDMRLAEAPAGAADGQPGAMDAQLLAYAQALAANPFIEQAPMLLDAATPCYVDAPAPHFMLRAPNGDAVPVDPRFQHSWQMHALAGGAPVSLFGLWDGRALLPLALTAADRRLYSFDAEAGK